MQRQTEAITFFRWAIPIGLGLSVTAWYPYASNPGIVGKFLGVYLFGILVAFWALRKVLAPVFSIRFAPLNLGLLVVIIGAAIVSALSSQSLLTLAGDSKHHEGVLAFLFYGLVYLLAADEKAPIDTHSLSTALSVSVILNLLIGLMPSERAYGLEFGQRFLGSFAEPNFLAGFLIISIPLAAVLMIHGRTVSYRLLGASAFVLALAQLFMTQSRSGYVTLAVACSVFLIAAWTKSSSRLRLFYALFPITLISWGIFYNRFSLSSLKEGVLARYSSWGSINDTWSYLLTGPGPGRFQHATQNRYSALGAHNAYIDYAGNIGWLAVAAYALLIALAVYRLIVSINGPTEIPSLSKPLLLAAIVGYAFFSFTSYTRVSSNLVFWAVLGITAGMTKNTREISLTNAVKGLVAVLLVLSIVVAASTSALLLAGGWHARLGLRSPNDAVKWNRLSQAIRYEPWNVDYRTIRGNLSIKFAKEADQKGLRRDVLEAAIEDWGFLYEVALGNLNSYANVDFFYELSNTPIKERLERPPGYDRLLSR